MGREKILMKKSGLMLLVFALSYRNKYEYEYENDLLLLLSGIASSGPHGGPLAVETQQSPTANMTCINEVKAWWASTAVALAQARPAGGMHHP